MSSPDSGKSKYSLNEKGHFIIDDYNSARPFSSFFPGMAGINGMPMWVFYVNRGQCICSMGVQDKDHALIEFFPANRAYNLASSHGFRTFLRFSETTSVVFYEPFQSHSPENKLSRVQRMIIAPSHLTLEEINHSLKLKFTVHYFTVPQDKYAGLVRTLSIHNLGSEPVSLEGLDGLPVIVPYGVDNFSLKNMRRTIEAFVEVCNLDNGVPFFKAKVEPADRPDVLPITKGNFYIVFEDTASGTNIVKPVVDPNKIFGSQTDFCYPERFLEMPFEDLIMDQKLENQLPCAMGLFKTTLQGGESYNYFSIIGHVSSLNKINKMVSDIARRDYIELKQNENSEIVQTLTQNNLICSSEPGLDYYVRQNFLDNTMRGGFPFTFAAGENNTTLYLFSRKHGDMERDYNDFTLTPTPYSQGNGNFRDINQNRRSDLLFNPDLGKENVAYFYNLIQLDGFNPLILRETYFEVKDIKKLQNVLTEYIEEEHLKKVESFLGKAFTPGKLLAFLEENGMAANLDSETFIAEVLDHCQKIYRTDYGESYWIDHWTYNLDLLENYLAVYPEKFQDFLFSDKTFSFYDNPHIVQPRGEKYVLWNGKVMQLDAVLFDEEKAHLIESRKSGQNLVRSDHGRGAVYYTTLFNKILCLIVNKMASLDPEGVGVEMEAGKPGWYDALNGLPGLFGSSICETLEIKRHILFLLEKIKKYNSGNYEVEIFEELKEFMDELFRLLNSELQPFDFWEAASGAKENYRKQIKIGVSGEEVKIELDSIEDFLEAALDKLNKGIEKSRDIETDTIFTYFRHEVTEYEELTATDSRVEDKRKLNSEGLPCIKPLKFRQFPLPLFLEGPVHYLRCIPEKKRALELAENIKKSSLYDKQLKMYKVNSSLKDEPMEIGRARVFSPGWLENESIWLHMEYKYMLELLRNGLYDEFFKDFKNIFIPFLHPSMYGRSILENSSFLVSSANPDPSIHGNGFVARLSGATAEFIHILFLMLLGPRPFSIGAGEELQLDLKPSLPGWLFTTKEGKVRIFQEGQWNDISLPANSLSFMFLGKIFVTYHNISLKDTFGEKGVSPIKYEVTDSDGNKQPFEGGSIKGDIARKIRQRKVTRIEVILG